MKHLKIFFVSFIRSNPVFTLGLGLCSTLAVTLRVENAIFMSILVTLATLVSSAATSFFRYSIPHRYRLMVYMLIISASVISIEQLFKAIVPQMAYSLGPYVSLIVTNCIILGRLESFAVSHGVLESILDALAVCAGYSSVLMLMSVIREVLGNGTIWGLKVLPVFYVPNRLFNSAPGAFLIFAALLFAINYIRSLLDGAK